MDKIFAYGSIFIFLIIISQQSFARSSDYYETIKVDSTKYNSPDDVKYLPPTNLFELRMLFNNPFREPEFIARKYKLMNKNYKYLNLDIRSVLDFQQRDYSTDEQFAEFKEALYKSLEAKYRVRNKYDLGEFGKYLGISRKIMAIILAILSLL